MSFFHEVTAIGWFVTLAILGGIHSTAYAAEDRAPVVVTDKARQLHARSLVIDGHNDMPWEIRKQSDSDFSKLDISQPQKTLQTDIPRLRAGGVGAQFWSVWVPVDLGYKGEALATTLEQIELVKRMVHRYPDTFELAVSTDDIERIHKEGQDRVADRRRRRALHPGIARRLAKALRAGRPLHDAHAHRYAQLGRLGDRRSQARWADPLSAKKSSAR